MPESVSDAFFRILERLFEDGDWHGNCISFRYILVNDVLLIVVIRSIKEI